jgi:hypothetical protein
MRADFVALGICLGWVGADEKEEPAIEAGIGRLRYKGNGILLIFDNAVDAGTLKPYRFRLGSDLSLSKSDPVASGRSLAQSAMNLASTMT